MENNLKKLLIILILSGLFSTLATDFVFAKTKGEFMTRFKELSQDVQQEKKIEIQCWKNPDACLLPLKPLSIDESGNIEGIEIKTIEARPLSDNIIGKIKQVFASLGLAVENGIVRIKELVAEKITATKRIIAPVGQFEKIEMRDKATGEIYCTWIENGEWVKSKGECGGLTSTTSETTASETTTPTEAISSEAISTEATTIEPTPIETAISTESTSTATATESVIEPIEPSTTAKAATTESTTTEPAISTEEPATSTIQ